LEPGDAGAQQATLPRTGHAIVMRAAYTAVQVNPMRFSSAFQPKPQPAREQRVEEVRETPQPIAAAPGQDLPDDLDARVRLVGEWQLGEA